MKTTVKLLLFFSVLFTFQACCLSDPMNDLGWCDISGNWQMSLQYRAGESRGGDFAKDFTQYKYLRLNKENQTFKDDSRIQTITGTVYDSASNRELPVKVEIYIMGHGQHGGYSDLDIKCLDPADSLNLFEGSYSLSYFDSDLIQAHQKHDAHFFLYKWPVLKPYYATANPGHLRIMLRRL